jgi:hypothetical protein
VDETNEDKAMSLEEWIESYSDEGYLELITIRGVVYAFRLDR